MLPLLSEVFGKRPTGTAVDPSLCPSTNKNGQVNNPNLKIMEDTQTNFTTPILNYILSHCEGDNRPYLTIDILGISLKGLLYTGASRTILGAPGWKLI